MPAMSFATCQMTVLLGLAAGLLVPAISAVGASAKGPVQFNRDIQPILSDNCYACHGPDEGHRKAKLRLDVRESAIDREAIVPGQPGASELMVRILSADPDEVMPPPDSHKTLTPEQQELLKRWIAEGAVYQKHWAYEPPVKPALPAGQNGIDHLVGQRLKGLGLKFSPAADRRVLARRLSFDLLGMPPEPAQVAAFARDRAPDAYSRFVEQLLASPHYGERMAIPWLDVVRFADTIGYHSDNPRNIWPYRDYVIDAFNRNKPFDRFTREQLAGDLLADATQETRVASAFNRLLLTTEEGGAQEKDYEARMLTDRVRAVSSVWLGQTIGCAQCHDHKFDPSTQRDFYALGAFFADLEEPIIGRREPGMLVPDEPQAVELARLGRAVDEVQARYDAPHPELEPGLAQWTEAQRTALARDEQWTVLRPESLESVGMAKLELKEDGSIFVSGEKPDKDTYTLRVRNLPAGALALRVEALPEDSLPGKGPGRSGNGNFVLTELAASLVRSDGSIQSVAFASARAGFEQSEAADKHPDKAWTAGSVIDGDEKGGQWGWAVQPQFNRRHHLVLNLAEALHLPEGGELVLQLRQNHGQGSHTLGKIRLALAVDSETIAAPLPAPLPEDVIAVLVSREPVNPEGRAKVLAHYKTIAPELAGLRQEIADAKKALSDYEATVARCLVSTSAKQPRTVRLLPRGNWMIETGEVMKPALPAYLAENHPVPADRALNRLDLAEWLVSRQNPLTARVVMNRLWKQFFGTGLSKVLDDFGMQGEPPRNPELLDWLAVEFMDSGWDMKHMVRLILNSRTYRQVSTASPKLLALDPENRELARQGRWRLDAELVRDNALSLAGLLEPDIGGPSVKPYQPDGYWENLNFPVRKYEPDEGDAQYRRGLYTWWQRSYVHPSMLAFDAPTREECAAERARSNIPQQALVLLNDPTFVEAARVFAARIMKEGGDRTDDRIRWAWQQALLRKPDTRELATLRELVKKHAAEYGADPEAAAALLKVGLKPLPADVDAGELATWTSVARVILNLHETVTRS